MVKGIKGFYKQSGENRKALLKQLGKPDQEFSVWKNSPHFWHIPVTQRNDTYIFITVPKRLVNMQDWKRSINAEFMEQHEDKSMNSDRIPQVFSYAIITRKTDILFVSKPKLPVIKDQWSSVDICYHHRKMDAKMQ